MTWLFFASKEYFWKARKELGFVILPQLKVLSIWTFAYLVGLVLPFYALCNGIGQWIVCFIIAELEYVIRKIASEPVFASFFCSKEYFWEAYGRGGILLAIIGITVWVNSMFAQGLGTLGEILQQEKGHTYSEFPAQILWLFLYVNINGTLFQTIQTKNTQMFTLGWRKAMTYYFIPLLGKIIGKEKIEGISQRLQEEPQKFSDGFETIVVQLIYAVLSLIVFIPQLWSISPPLHLGTINIHTHGIFFKYPLEVDIPGTLCIIVFVVGIFGMWNSFRMGKSFPGMVKDNRAKEVVFRAESEQAEAGETPFNPQKMKDYFSEVYKSYAKRIKRYVPFNRWMSAYWGAIVILPLYIMGNGIIHGLAEYSALAQVTFIFSQSISNFSVFTNNWAKIVDLEATVERLDELHKAINDPNNWVKKPKKWKERFKGDTLTLNGKNIPMTKLEMKIVLRRIRKKQ